MCDIILYQSTFHYSQVVIEAEAQTVFYASNIILMYFTPTEITYVSDPRRIKSSQDKYDP